MHVIVILFGLVIGSFLNVCIYRIPRQESVVFERSHCPACKTFIQAWENIPLFSFIFLRGKCRHCGAPISWVYPTVEVATAGLIYLLFLKYGFESPFFLNAALFCMLVVLFFIDLFERILPDIITLSGMAAGILLSPFQSSEFIRGDPFLGTPQSLGSTYLHSSIGALLGGGILWVVAIAYLKIKKIEGMGFGDIKMMAMVGAFLGWRYAWLTVFFGSLIGAVVGSIYIYTWGKGTRYELPFGTFLAIGAVATTLWGPAVVAWYVGKL